MSSEDVDQLSPLALESISIENKPSLHRRPAGFRSLAILAAFVLPIGLAPYLLLRRRIYRLNKTIEDLKKSNFALIQDVKQLRLESSANADALARSRFMDRETTRKVDLMKIHADQKDIASNKALSGLRNDIRRLGESTSAQSAHLGALGTSLADVAAFMYEVNIRHGTSNEQTDKKVEDLRSVALMMVHDHRQARSFERGERYGG